MDLEPRPPRATIWCCALIVIATLVTFGPLVRCGFTDWDDPDTIWSNPHLRPATLASVGYYWTHAEAELYVPLTYTVWGGLAQLGQRQEANGASGPNPAVFHAANVAVHMLAALAAFLLLRRVVKSDWR